jgi:hypothetical protein
MDEFMLQFKAEASQTDLGDAALIEYSKAGHNPSLFKSIYQLPVMPTTLEQWYEWAFKFDWQYRQEQAESKLLHPHTGSKFGKLYGSSEKGKAPSMEKKAQPLAMAVTLPSQDTQSHASDAMDVDCGGRQSLPNLSSDVNILTCETISLCGKNFCSINHTFLEYVFA